jgi:HEAT repeat protein
VAARAAKAPLRARVAAALAARLPSAPGYELRYRLLAAAGGLPEPATIAAVAGALAARGEEKDLLRRAQAVALRRVAVAALAENPAEATLAPLLVALGDPDPGVRVAAAAALAERFFAPGLADDALVSRLRADRWPEVRREAALALGSRCKRAQPTKALFFAADRDGDVDVRNASLSALVGCRAPGVGERLMALARDRAQPYGVRVHSVKLIGKLGERGLAAALGQELRRFIAEATRAEPAVRLAAAAAWALGRLHSPGSVGVLMDTAREIGAPEIRAAAALALGEYCGAAEKKLLTQLTSSDERAVKLAAGRALSNCRRAEPRPR